MKDINTMFSELAQYTRIQEETTAVIEGLKDEIKQYMIEQNTDILTGNEHKATYKAVESSRLDSKALKASYPDIVKAYTKTSTTRRFLFA